MKEMKEHELSNTLNRGLSVVPKTDGEISFNQYGWIHNYIHMFSALCQKRLCFWKYRKWGYHLKNCYRKNIYAKMVENARINFSVCPYHILFFSRKENLKSFEVALAVVLCNDVLAVLWICEAICIEILQYHTRHLLAFCKTAIKILKQDVKFVQTYQVYYNNWLLSW